MGHDAVGCARYQLTYIVQVDAKGNVPGESRVRAVQS